MIAPAPSSLHNPLALNCSRSFGFQQGFKNERLQHRCDALALAVAISWITRQDLKGSKLLEKPTMISRATSAPKGVLLYGTGRVAQIVTRLLVDRGWPIVAAFNRAGDKIGKDLGLLAGLPKPLGVVIQDSNSADLANIGADIAVVMTSDRLRVNFPVYERLIRSGVNVLSVGSEASYPWVGTPDLAKQIDQLAKDHSVSFCGSGFQDVHRIWQGLTLIGGCCRLRGFLQESQIDVALFGSEVAHLVRAGMSVDQFRRETKDGNDDISIYRVFLQQIVHALGLEIISVEQRLEPVVSARNIACESLGTTIPAGFCTGTRFITEIRSCDGVTATASNELRLFAPDEQAMIRWSIDGDPPAEVIVTGFRSDIGTATPLVNRIPQVIAAEPGIVTIDRLGPVQFLGNPAGNGHGSAVTSPC
jgi:4-hydroxy-tetrahydrodipicolinate reductase